jgi:formate dehydrogenase major subunit
MNNKPDINNKITININGKEIKSLPSLTILQAAAREGIHIPHLCSDFRIKRNDGQCGLCIVEVGEDGQDVHACTTLVQDGMQITTNSKNIESYRKVRLEQLLSHHNADCLAPCVKTCPANIDIQTYLRQVANGNFRAALRVIKDKNPFALVCGRVCPHFCESVCRRELVDEPININGIKRFVADIDINSKAPYVPQKKENTGKRVAIIGAGPSGLSAAYYSAVFGHDVTVFEKQQLAGGMMRWGIPEYRLPKDTLDKEINIIEKLDVKIQTNKALGTHIRLEDLQQDFDAVYLSVGSCLASTLRIDGDRARGAWLGITFLERVTKGINVETGSTVVVIGGGNTAIDCARTAIRRPGVKEVHLIYRRTQDEMPAEKHEIEEALTEGVKMNFLMSPVCIEFDSTSRYINGVKFMKMELGPPDLSGRRRPIPVENAEEILIPATSVIGAVGQSTDTSYLWDDLPLKKNKWGDIKINGKTMETSAPKIFAGGDCVTGPATVIQAVAAGKQAAECMHEFIENGYVKEHKNDYACSRGTLEDLPRHEFEEMPKIERAKIPKLVAEDRKYNFKEVEHTLDEKLAIEEAKRCLKCGCSERSHCKLRNEASNHEIKHKSPLQELERYKILKDHPFISRDLNKCISCGLCVSVCKDMIGPNALGIVIKNGHILVGTCNGEPLKDTECVSCGHCVTACPSGALDYKRESDKVFQALNDPNKIVIGFVAPAVRSVVAAKFNLEFNKAMPILAGILKSKKLGFNKVFDFCFSADLTICEETTEFVRRLEKGADLPHLTSCCPGWVNFVEQSYPELIPHLSTCKSPQQMMGSVMKSHFIEWAKLKERKKDVFVVSIVPCIAKKYEAERPEFVNDGQRDVDAVLTTTELFEMINRTKVDTENVAPVEYDDPYRMVSGAGVIFGVSGGVAEAALRMAAEKVENKKLDNVDYTAVRGLEGIKVANVELGGKIIRLAVVSGLKNVVEIANKIKNGQDCGFDFIEVMTCPGGCIDGAGHPVPQDSRELAKRKQTLREIDKNAEYRKSQDNPDVQNLYKEYFGEPNSTLAHNLLHTHYENRRKKTNQYKENVSDETRLEQISVCVDTHCFNKGSASVLAKIQKIISDKKLQEKFIVRSQLCKGHCEDEGVFVSINGIKVSEEDVDNIENVIDEINKKSGLL